MKNTETRFSACIKRRYNMKVYADNAATTTISQHALAEMIQYYGEEYENASSLHTQGQAAADALEEAKQTTRH